jgi:hypothetical protein
LVIRHVSGLLTLNTATEAPLFSLYSSQTPFPSWSFVGKVGAPNYGIPNWTFNEDVLAVFDPTDTTPYVGITSSYLSGQAVNVTLTGYLENCSITGCPAIVH